MKCPVCPDTTLLISDRQGVEIDYCPNCRGIWLDRGELDKLIQLSVAQEVPARAAPAPAPAQPYPPQYPDPGYGYGKHGRGHHRRKSWLSEIFD